MKFKIRIKGRDGEVEAEYSHPHDGFMHHVKDYSDKGFSELHTRAFAEIKVAYKALSSEGGSVAKGEER